MPEQIIIRGARLHNLKNITLAIPRNRLVVLTGPSGSGKSTLGFDILLKEGQRQYLESLGLVTFGLARPPVDAISGLSPTISIDQHLTNHSPRSTAGTVTEVYTYMRVLFARLGHRPCPACGHSIPPSHHAAAAWEAPKLDDEDKPETLYPCPYCGTSVPELTMAHFSFNKPAGACPTCTGLGTLHQPDLGKLVDEQKSIASGAVAGWEANNLAYQSAVLQAAAAYYGFSLDLNLPVKDLPIPPRDLLFYGVENPLFRRHFPSVEPPSTVRQGRFEGVGTAFLRRYAERVNEPAYREKMEPFMVLQACPDCAGTRLRPESRAVTVNSTNLTSLSHLSFTDLGLWLKDLPAALSPDEQAIALPILADLAERLAQLSEVGAGYLAMERSAPSLSAGEAQRLRLAGLLGSELCGVLYIFDEPSIGLHQRDTHRMIQLLRRLRDQENTVLVIEHDLEIIAAADEVIDFGPGAGLHGGQVVASGTPAEVAAHPTSLTGAYLSGRLSLPAPLRRRQPAGPALILRGACHHNLKNLTISLPLGLLVAVTGVSGSGKSSLIFDTLAPLLRQRLSGANETPGAYASFDGAEHLERVITIDQQHLQRMARSNTATYTDIFTPIREAFAATPEARRQGFTARQFSFNVPGGRCERCEGAGVLAVTMHFMPEVDIRCPACRGRRFTPETLTVEYRGHDISRVLDLTVEEALDLFEDLPAARSRLQVLMDVGLGYLQLGQPTNTLSGGEAQRVKLAKELGRRSSGRTLYLLDEPTTGLHPADTARLLGLLQRLVDGGSSVLVVEHNLDLVRAADWVIDLGPEGGSAGGQLMAQGTPEEVMQVEASITGQCLRKMLLSWMKEKSSLIS
ncbi:MAG TPA: excinuclease ABC subunit UvrA [Anaerolineaceae bacterium]|nr:excinuclease ABC subunit UvrA [Anaerolineaceae bacterium]